MKLKQDKGIVLVEAIIAVGVLVTIFTAAMSLYTVSVGGIRITNDQVIATYLAQDALEIVIARRQFNYEQSHTNHWLDGISGCTTGSPCAVSYYDDISSANPFSSCVSASICPLRLDANGVYNPDNGDVTHFHRSISSTPITGMTASSTRIQSRVWWQDGGGNILEYSLWHTIYANPN